MIRPTPEVNQEILENRMAKVHKHVGPTIGDWVLFNEGIARRISHIWHYDEKGESKPAYEDWGIQTSQPGYYGWYLGNGYISFSGSLYMAVKGKWLTLTEELRPAWVWFFSRDHHTAHNGVYFKANFKVWDANIDAPSV